MEKNVMLSEIMALLRKAEPEELDWIYIFLRTYFSEKLKSRP